MIRKPPHALPVAGEYVTGPDGAKWLAAAPARHRPFFQTSVYGDGFIVRE